MKYAVAMWMDQTIGFATADGAETERASEAVLFDTKEAAETAKSFDCHAWIHEVPDEAAFRAMAPTWTGRPYASSALFSLVREVFWAANNHDSKAVTAEMSRALSDAALNVLEVLGHRGGEKGWTFGPLPTPAEPWVDEPARGDEPGWKPETTTTDETR